MDKVGFVKNGVVMRLPPGFRFCPTDEELVVEYLKRKVFRVPLPASVIPEFDVCKSDPWDLPGDREKERYFFSTNAATKYLKGNRSNRATVSGYWRTTGKDKEIISSRTKQVVGMKKTLVFCRGKPPHGSKTEWIMHEYRLVGVENFSTNVPQKMNPIQSFVENWVVCRISLKKRNSKLMYEPMQPLKSNSMTALTNTQLMNRRLDLNLSPCSSGSSGVTEISNSELDDHEESSS